MCELLQGLSAIRQLGREGKYKEAFRVCTELEKEFPNNAEIFFLKGSAYFKVGDLDRARVQWETSLSIDSTHARARKFLAQIRPQVKGPEADSDFFSTLTHPAKSLTSGFLEGYSSSFDFGIEPLAGDVPKPKPRKKRLEYDCVLARGLSFITDGVILVLPTMVANHFLSIGGLLTAWLYFAYYESSAGEGTLGKQIMGLQVIGLEGGQVSFLKATGRFIAKILSTIPCFLGYLFAPFTSRKQALHDLLARTLVVRAKPGRTPVALGVILGGLAFNFAVGMWYTSYVFGSNGQVASPNTSASMMSNRQAAPQSLPENNSAVQPVQPQEDPFGIVSAFDEASGTEFAGLDLYEDNNDYVLYDDNAFGYDLSQLQVRYEGEMIIVRFPNYAGFQDYEFSAHVDKAVDPTGYTTKVNGKELRIIISKK